MTCIPKDLQRMTLFPCFKLADTDNNDELSELEITSFLDLHNITTTTVNTILEMCDMNHDGKLTMYDLEVPNSCLIKRSTRLLLCIECNKLQAK